MEYGVKRARAADYSVNTLSGLKVYFADFLQKREARDRGREEAAERQEQDREQQAQAAYATFRKRRAEELLAAVAEDLRDEIETTAVARALAKRPSFQGATDRMTIYFERIALIEERIGLPTFEEWRSSISRAQ
jgi:hypothetical protein